MSRRRTKRNPDEPAPIARRSYRPSPRFALQISLGFHALIVLMLFRMVSEYAGEPEVPLKTVVRSYSLRPAATPSFVAVPQAAAENLEEINLPAARVETLPHQETSFAQGRVAPLRQATPGARRAIAPAVLPIASVAVPTEDVVPLPAVDAPISITPSQPALAAADTLADLPLRIASRTIYGPRAERPLGLALLPAVQDDTRPRRPADAYAHRFAAARTPKENRSAIDRGLEFLARMQLDDGRWQFRNLRGEVDPHAELPCPRADAAATGLALLAFLGAGHDHLDGRYRHVVDDGLQYLVRTQRSSGDFFLDDGRPTGQLSRFYGHGIATLALCEAFGMTGDQRLRAPAQRAIDFLVGARYPEPGSWRYLPGVDADATAIGWQLATLRSGQLAGLNVAPDTLDNIRAFLARSRDATARHIRTPSTPPSVSPSSSTSVARAATRGSGLRPTNCSPIRPKWARQTKRSKRKSPTIPSAIPITGTTAPRQCIGSAATTGSPGRGSSIPS